MAQPFHVIRFRFPFQKSYLVWGKQQVFICPLMLYNNRVKISTRWLVFGMAIEKRLCKTNLQMCLGY